ncbi:MAG: ABC transporter ATP-binding protein [Desulfobacteraceae bacterium]|nr:ABC transporter ATP-binding protein [Desulfobacteraceae bacterium]
MKLIELQRITKHYHLGQTPMTALKDVTLSFDKGEFTAVWGPSGSGKTTLLNLIGTIDEPSSGKVLIHGEDVSKMSDNRKSEYRNKKIGFIFQNFNLIPVLNALENVMLPLQIRNEKTRSAKARAMDRLSQVGLEHLALNRPDMMSGGQRQRVAIARALVTDPEVVVADEPTANLDLATSMGIMDIMQKLNQSEGATFLFSTHDQRLLDRMTRLVRLEDGCIADGPAN